jgi:predicted nuclease of predicted toxin-antitoxin system
MKILIDMNLSPLWVDVLTAAGIEAMHWSTIDGSRLRIRILPIG